MRRKLLDLCAREGLLPPGSHVVCAVSGGIDSVALLHCLLSLREELSVTVSAAHFNHCLRGAESDGDEVFVRELCECWQVPLAVGRGDVTAVARAEGRSLEEAARHLRYAFLDTQPGLLATAHHGDDQIETVLLNLIRGTGLKGLTGIAPKQGRIIRPLLTASRDEIVRYADEYNLPHREDSSNNRDDALRNRLRHRVVPLLREENPNLTDTVARMSGLLRADEAFLETETEALLSEAQRGDGWDCRPLRKAPPVLRRRALRGLLPGPKPAMTHVDALEHLLLQTEGTAELTLPGCSIRRCYDTLTFASDISETFAPVQLFPGETVFLGDRKAFLSFPVKWDGGDGLAIPADCPVWLRPRQTGDVIATPGGTRSVKKLMIDRKVPAHLRESVPVITDGEHILAVWKLAADPTRLAKPGDAACILSICNPLK